MDIIAYKAMYTIKYDFDTENITEEDRREIIKMHYDFLRWCENNTTAPYVFNKQYSPDGILIGFKSLEDHQRFFTFIQSYYSIFLHN